MTQKCAPRAAKANIPYPAHLSTQVQGDTTHVTCHVCAMQSQSADRKEVASFIRGHRRCGLSPSSVVQPGPVLPKPVTLKVSFWHGDPPGTGHWMRSQGARARYAYEIIAVDFRGDRVHSLTCRRHPAAAVPQDAFLHWWEWSPRNKRA